MAVLEREHHLSLREKMANDTCVWEAGPRGRRVPIVAGKLPFTLKDVFLFALFSLLIWELVIISCSHGPHLKSSLSLLPLMKWVWISFLNKNLYWTFVQLKFITESPCIATPQLQSGKHVCLRVSVCSVAVDVMPSSSLRVPSSPCVELFWRQHDFVNPEAPHIMWA